MQGLGHLVVGFIGISKSSRFLLVSCLTLRGHFKGSNMPRDPCLNFTRGFPQNSVMMKCFMNTDFEEHRVQERQQKTIEKEKDFDD